LGLAAAASAAPAPLHAQASPGAWMVGSDAGLDLWYHGLALAGMQGTAGELLYDPGYPAQVARAREAMGLPPTPLEEAAGELRARLLADPAFEVFHFVPLYFPGVGRQSMLAALQAVADAEEGPPSVADPSARFGAAALAGVLARPDQRDVMGAFVELLEREWDDFYERYHQDRMQSLVPVLQEVQTVWGSRVGPRLAPFLERYALDRGWIFLSQPLGWDGRILAGDASNPWDNQVAIGYGDDSLSEGLANLVQEVVIRSVRELCYPAVRAATERIGVEFSDPVSGARTSSVAAVRCGAMVLDRYLPEFSEPYRLDALGRREWAGEETGAGAFEERFPLVPALERALEEGVEPAG
jgi:hypothetical protein